MEVALLIMLIITCLAMIVMCWRINRALKYRSTPRSSKDSEVADSSLKG